jgi:hypothetical protein
MKYIRHYNKVPKTVKWRYFVQSTRLARHLSGRPTAQELVTWPKTLSGGIRLRACIMRVPEEDTRTCA